VAVRPVASSRPRSTCRWRRRRRASRSFPSSAERVEVERWQPGYWRWNGHEHVWVEGHYVAARVRAPNGFRAAGSSARAAGSMSKATGIDRSA
jgi:hypothetical protein